MFFRVNIRFMAELNSSKWYMWHAYYTLGFVWAVLAVCLLLLIDALLGLENLLVDLILIAMIPAFFLLPICGIMSVYGYYGDSKHLKNAEALYRPSWPLWILGHVILPALVPIFYLLHRSARVGNEYSGTYLEKVPYLFTDSTPDHLYCANCGENHGPTDRYCGQCGHALDH